MQSLGLYRARTGFRSCRYHYNANPLLPKIKARLKFADGAAIKSELDQQIAGLLGPKTEADLVKPDKKTKKKV